MNPYSIFLNHVDHVGCAEARSASIAHRQERTNNIRCDRLHQQKPAFNIVWLPDALPASAHPTNWLQGIISFIGVVCARGLAA
jgi:hypothetical protein